MARPRGPLKFKGRDMEIVFHRDSVESVMLRSSHGLPWQVWVNGACVYSGQESKARKEYARALRYVS